MNATAVAPHFFSTTIESKQHESGRVHRMTAASAETNPSEGRVVWGPVKSLWFTAHLLVAIIGGWLTFGMDEVLVAFILTVVTLCTGHTVGLHRLLIHRSFNCPRWLEYLLVHLGTVVGMGGPLAMIYQHDIRDWAQRHLRCHDYFTDQGPLWRDWLWQMHTQMRLDHPPRFTIEPRVAGDPIYRWMQRTWMAQQLPWALALYLIGGIGWVVWGISVRIVVSLTGHWFIGWLAHNVGQRDWHLEGHAVQGYNLPHLGLLTMGEGWHNNHHAYPESAQLGHRNEQHDPGWWFIRLLIACGLAHQVKTPATLPAERPGRHVLPRRRKARASAMWCV